jgi:Fe-S-cluster containining protein
MVTNISTVGDRFCESGLKFTCTRCSCCCRFDSGYVWLSRGDLEGIARHLGLTVKSVVERYCRIVDVGGMQQISLTEQPNMDCVFWQEGSCSIYEHRPVQCRTYPFWGPHLDSRESWDRLEESCPGVNIGRMHAPQEIDELVRARVQNTPCDAGRISEIGS